ncbi:MAG: matrixin family metalloprotease [Vicinamibacterales bacterium]|jgi:hypothetical protein
MTARRRTLCGAALALALCLTTMESPKGFSLLANKWPNGTVTMQMQLGSGSGTLIDGSTSWNQVATNALATWNTHIDLVKFSAVNDSTASRGDGTGSNNVFFDSAVYGRAFGADTLAIATSWYNTATNNKIEGDVVFNNTKRWDSYRGNQRSGTFDFFRVALHEFGHVLGLDHPDENGQSVNALMNSTIGNLDALAADDISGIRSLYGAGVTSNISFPPRNEPNDFFNQLIAVYRDELRAGQVTTYVDPEGIVVWLIEYARYRVGLCDHNTATTRVFSAIDNTGVYGVCALTPAGTIPFPPRNEGLDFMNGLQVKYRDGLGRSAGSSFVNNEGAVVWVLEYLRYRLNSCSHGDATTKVFMQIRGQGIQPVCR